jgi:hypothetical protein
MRMALLAPLLALTPAGCVESWAADARARSYAACSGLASERPEVRAAAEKDLRDFLIFVAKDGVTATDRARLAPCARHLARLLADHEVPFARMTLGSLASLIGPLEPEVVVPAVLADAQALWTRLEAVPGDPEAEASLWEDVQTLGDYGASARAALPLLEAITSRGDADVGLARGVQREAAEAAAQIRGSAVR